MEGLRGQGFPEAEPAEDRQVGDAVERTGNTIKTSDPKLALRTLCRRSCNAMHGIASLMEQVISLKENCSLRLR